MPFKSEAQRKWMWANKPNMAKEWAEHTPKGKKLPEHVKESMLMIKPGELNEFSKNAYIHGPLLAGSYGALHGAAFSKKGKKGAGAVGGAAGAILGAPVGGAAGGIAGGTIGGIWGGKAFAPKIRKIPPKFKSAGKGTHRILKGLSTSIRGSKKYLEGVGKKIGRGRGALIGGLLGIGIGSLAGTVGGAEVGRRITTK